MERWANENKDKHYSKYNNEAACKAGGGDWLPFHNYLEYATGANNKNQCLAKNRNSDGIRYIEFHV